MKTIWFFNDGVRNIDCVSFPYAFRNLFFAYKKGLEQKRNAADMTKAFYIKSPLGKIYSYRQATEMAEAQGLLNAEGQLNSREFKK